jgi:hypothetical protein
MLPSFLPKQLAEKVLLTGKAINFLRACCHDEQWVREFALQGRADAAVTSGSSTALTTLDGLQQSGGGDEEGDDDSALLVRKMPLLSNIYIYKRSFYQDRLGTNTGNVEKREGCWVYRTRLGLSMARST